MTQYFFKIPPQGAEKFINTDYVERHRFCRHKATLLYDSELV